MASSKSYLAFVLEQLSGLPEITHRAMMGEYLLYFRGKLVGGIYDDRFLVKDVPAARALMPDVPLERPYEGAKEMIPVTELDDRAFLEKLLPVLYDQLPAPKPKKK